MLSGIPPKFHPTLKCVIKPFDELEDFRRILIDCEQGLRPWLFDGKGNRKKKYIHDDSESDSDSDSGHRGKSKHRSQQHPKRQRDPLSACGCGGMHWRSDWPKGNSSGSQNNNSANQNNNQGTRSSGYNNNGSWYNRTKPSNSLYNNNNGNNRNNPRQGNNNGNNATANAVFVKANPVKTRKQRKAPLSSTLPCLQNCQRSCCSNRLTRFNRRTQMLVETTEKTSSAASLYTTATIVNLRIPTGGP